MSIENYYTNLATIQSKTEATNTFGAVTETWSDKSTINCLINQASSTEILQAQQINERVTNKMYCAYDTNINNKDRIVFNSQVYRIVSIPKNTVNRNHHLKIMLALIGTDNE